MRGLFFKVFIILWIAQSLIFVISTALIVRHHLGGPDAFFDALHIGLQNEAMESAAAFEAGGCDGMRAYASARGQQIALLDATGQNQFSVAGAQTSWTGDTSGNACTDEQVAATARVERAQ